MRKKNVVLLVDNKQRDLLSATLIAHHLDALGVECHLEPLGAYQGVLAAYRPEMIIFNHLTAGHLVKYSKRLAGMGVLTAILTNEGITYEEALLKFIVGSHHTDAHIDYFFSWNDEMRKAMAEVGFGGKTKVEVVGIPRFDFYCRPWSRMFEEEKRAGGKPRVLVCTNFAYAEYYGLPPEKAQRIFAAVKDVNPVFEDYQRAIEVHHENRLRVFPFLDEVMKSGRFELTVRPHPYEKIDPYRAWWEGLSAGQREGVKLDKESNITRLILNHDLQISCETCTTALEAWIAGKPTVELVFQRYPVYFHEEHAALQPNCERPGELAPLLERELERPEQPEYGEGRRAHLRKWCHSPDGKSSSMVAELVARAVLENAAPDWSKLSAADHRRGAKLKLLRGVGEPYNYNPFLGLKRFFSPKRFAIKTFTYEKSIKPGDVTEMRRRLENNLVRDGSRVS